MDEEASPVPESASKSKRFTQDQIDNLKLEASSSTWTPKLEKQTQDLTATMAQTVLELFGNFLPENASQRAQEVPKRVVVMDKKDLEWINKNYSPQASQNEAWGHYIDLEDYIELSSPLSFWERAPQQIRDKYMQAAHGNRLQAQLGLQDINFKGSLSHEVLHFFQGNDFHNLTAAKRAFLETAIRFYQPQVMEKIKTSPRVEEPEQEDIKRQEFYQQLLGKYGDDVHKLFFGTLNNPQRQKEILGEFNQQTLIDLFSMKKSQSK